MYYHIDVYYNQYLNIVIIEINILILLWKLIILDVALRFSDSSNCIINDCSISSDFQPTNFHTYFCYLNYTPSIKVSQAAIPVNVSLCFVLRNALYWIKLQVVFIEICQIKV